MVNSSKLIFALAISTAVSLSSCNDNKDIVPKQTVPASYLKDNYAKMKQTIVGIENTKWQFDNYKTQKLSNKVVEKATLEISKASGDSFTISGTSFINFYSNTLKIDITKGLIVSKGIGMSTLMAGSEEGMKAEQNYQSNLEKATYFEVNGDKLLIYLGDKTNSQTEVMTFLKK